MKFCDQGAHVCVSRDRKTAFWKENASSPSGYVLSEEPVSIRKGETLCQLEFKVKDYGRVLIGLFFKNPHVCISQTADFFDPATFEGVRNITNLSLKNQKTAQVKLTYNKGLNACMEFIGCKSPQILPVDIPKGQKSFWIFVKFVFGDIRVSLAGKRMIEWQQIGNLSRNIELNGDGSAQLRDVYAGHDCKIDQELQPWHKLVLKVSPVAQMEKVRSLFSISFTSHDASPMSGGPELTYTFKANKCRDEVCILHQGNSISCGNKVWKLKYQKSMKIEMKIVLSSVKIVKYDRIPKSSMEPESTLENPSTSLRTEGQTSQWFVYGDTDNSWYTADIPASHSGATGFTSTGACRDLNMPMLIPRCNQRDSLYDSPYDTETSSYNILRQNYTDLVRCIHYESVVDQLYSKHKMEKEDHRILIGDYLMNDHAKRRKTVDWMIDNASKISISELIEIFESVGQIKLLAPFRK